MMIKMISWFQDMYQKSLAIYFYWLFLTWDAGLSCIYFYNPLKSSTCPEKFSDKIIYVYILIKLWLASKNGFS